MHVHFQKSDDVESPRMKAAATIDLCCQDRNGARETSHAKPTTERAKGKERMPSAVIHSALTEKAAFTPSIVAVQRPGDGVCLLRCWQTGSSLSMLNTSIWNLNTVVASGPHRTREVGGAEDLVIGLMIHGLLR